MSAVALCGPHKERGYLVTAVRVVDGTPMCQGCAKGEPVPPRQAIARPLPEPEPKMRNEKCPCGRDVHHRGRCWHSRGLAGPVAGKATDGKASPRKRTGLDDGPELPARAYEYADLSGFPAQHRPLYDAEYIALWAKVLELPKGKCVRGPVPARAAATAKPASAVASSLRRIAQHFKGELYR